MDSIEDIMKGLSDTQKRAMLCASNGVIPSLYPTGLRIATTTFRALHRHGLTEHWPPRLTPIGLRVRAHLIQEPKP